MKGNPCYVSSKHFNQGFNEVLTLKIHLNVPSTILSRTKATQYMKHKIGNNPFTLPSMLNQQPVLLIHQPYHFVYKYASIVCWNIQRAKATENINLLYNLLYNKSPI
ncbi:hypothetical protein ACB094_03G034700 [Castanea mollissima]